MRVRELRIVYGAEITPSVPEAAEAPRTPAGVAAILLAILAQEPQEVFGVLLLNAKHRVLGWQAVHRGTTDTVQVSPADVFRAALLMNAPAIIVAHNHPSGECAPSQDDLDITRRLLAAGDLLGVQVLDHIITGEGRYFSFKEGGKL